MKYSRVITLGILLLGSLSGCSKGQYESSAEDASTYHYFQPDDVKTLDPAVAYDQVSWDIIPNTYESLYQYAFLSDPLQVEPLLAADLPKLSNDGLTVTIPLRTDVRFQDDPAFKTTQGKGRTITADDFIFSWKRLALPALQSSGQWIFDQKVAGFSAFIEKLVQTSASKKKEELAQRFEDTIEGFSALNEHTIQINLLRPYPQLKYVLTLPFTAVVPREAIEAYGDEAGAIHQKMVGTGPFLLKELNRGHRCILERNPNYHADFFPKAASKEFEAQGLLADAGKPLPLVERAVFEVIKEAQPAWLSFLNGKIDRMTVPKDNFDSAITQGQSLSPELKSKGFQLISTTEPTFFFLGFNMKDSVLGKNIKLRQALSSAIDRDRFIELFFPGQGQKMNSPIPPGINGRVKNPRLKFDFNLARAKTLLKEAGYAGGKGLSPLTLDMRGAASIDRQMGEFFAEQLEVLGVKTQVIYNTRPAYLEKQRQGNLQIFYGGWIMDYPDAENIFQLLYSKNRAPGPNWANFQSPEMDALFDKMARLPDGVARSKILAEMENLFQEQTPWALLYQRIGFRMAQGWLKNYRPSDMILNKLKYFRIDAEKKKSLFNTIGE